MAQLCRLVKRGFAQLGHAPRWMLNLKRSIDNFASLLAGAFVCTTKHK